MEVAMMNDQVKRITVTGAAVLACALVAPAILGVTLPAAGAPAAQARPASAEREPEPAASEAVPAEPAIDCPDPVKPKPLPYVPGPDYTGPDGTTDGNFQAMLFELEEQYPNIYAGARYADDGATLIIYGTSATPPESIQAQMDAMPNPRVTVRWQQVGASAADMRKVMQLMPDLGGLNTYGLGRTFGVIEASVDVGTDTSDYPQSLCGVPITYIQENHDVKFAAGDLHPILAIPG